MFGGIRPCHFQDRLFASKFYINYAVSSVPGLFRGRKLTVGCPVVVSPLPREWSCLYRRGEPPNSFLRASNSLRSLQVLFTDGHGIQISSHCRPPLKFFRDCCLKRLRRGRFTVGQISLLGRRRQRREPTQQLALSCMGGELPHLRDLRAHRHV